MNVKKQNRKEKELMAKERTPEQQAMMDQMDAAAVEAGVALAAIMAPDEEQTANKVADWWKQWYPKAGHKRLGKLLVKYAA